MFLTSERTESSLSDEAVSFELKDNGGHASVEKSTSIAESVDMLVDILKVKLHVGVISPSPARNWGKVTCPNHLKYFQKETARRSNRCEQFRVLRRSALNVPLAPAHLFEMPPESLIAIRSRKEVDPDRFIRYNQLEDFLHNVSIRMESTEGLVYGAFMSPQLYLSPSIRKSVNGTIKRKKEDHFRDLILQNINEETNYLSTGTLPQQEVVSHVASTGTLPQQVVSHVATVRPSTTAPLGRSKWTPEEEAKLIHAVNAATNPQGKIVWESVVSHFPLRSKSSLTSKWYKFKNNENMVV
jgi:hypothetical protein